MQSDNAINVLDYSLDKQGAYSFVSFLKKIWLPIDQREMEIMNGFVEKSQRPWADWRAIDYADQALFETMTDEERKAMILRQAADLHETHHFHCLLLVPAGEKAIQLLLDRLFSAGSTFDSLRISLAAGGEPFESVDVSSGISNPSNLLNYLFAGTLRGFPCSTERGVNIYPAARVIRHNTGPRGALTPAVHLGERDYPIGLKVIFEGWTESLISALVFRSRPCSYFDWYTSTRQHESLWEYGLVNRVLEDIFNSAYDQLDPEEKYILTSHVCLGACQAYLKSSPDYFDHQENHPGWNFLKICDYLWECRDILVVDGRLNVAQAVRLGNRVKCAWHQLGGFALVDDLFDLQVRSSAHKPQAQDILSTLWMRYSEFRLQVVRQYLEHGDSFHDAGEWLSSFQRSFLPKVPIMIGLKPGKKVLSLNFPDERNTEFWFTWFLLSQLLEGIIAGKPECPLLKYDLDADCPKDSDCKCLKILNKAQSCHLKRLLSTKSSQHS